MAVTPYDCLSVETNPIARTQIEKIEAAVDERLLQKFTGKNEVAINLAAENHATTVTILAYKYAEKGWHVTWVFNNETNVWNLTFSVKEELTPLSKPKLKERELPPGTIDLRKKEVEKRNLDLE